MSKKENKKELLQKFYDTNLQVFDTEEDLELIEDAIEDNVISHDELLDSVL